MTKVATSDLFTKWTHSVACRTPGIGMGPGEWLGTEGLICGRVVAARITLASSDDRISSSNGVKVCDISGLIDARVRVRISVPYLCLTSLGKST